jgi:hypothetical protein
VLLFIGQKDHFYDAQKRWGKPFISTSILKQKFVATFVEKVTKKLLLWY